MGWDGMGWDGMGWDVLGWQGMGLDGVVNGGVQRFGFCQGLCMQVFPLLTLVAFFNRHTHPK